MCNLSYNSNVDKKEDYHIMTKLKKLSLILLASAALLCGCTQSNIVSPSNGVVQGDGQPDLEVDKNINIDWQEVREDLRDQFLEPYGVFADYVMDLDAKYDAGSNRVVVLLPVSHKTTGEIAVVYGQEVLKAVGTYIAEQNFYYEAPDPEDTDSTYYGSYFDEHDVLVQVFPYDKEGDESAYLVNDVMKAGEQRELTAQIQ